MFDERYMCRIPPVAVFVGNYMERIKMQINADGYTLQSHAITNQQQYYYVASSNIVTIKSELSLNNVLNIAVEVS